MTCDSNKNIKTFSCRLWFSCAAALQNYQFFKLVNFPHLMKMLCLFNRYGFFSSYRHLSTVKREGKNGPTLQKPSEIMMRYLDHHNFFYHFLSFHFSSLLSQVNNSNQVWPVQITIKKIRLNLLKKLELQSLHCSPVMKWKEPRGLAFLKMKRAHVHMMNVAGKKIRIVKRCQKVFPLQNFWLGFAIFFQQNSLDDSFVPSSNPSRSNYNDNNFVWEMQKSGSLHRMYTRTYLPLVLEFMSNHLWDEPKNVQSCLFKMGTLWPLFFYPIYIRVYNYILVVKVLCDPWFLQLQLP